MRIDKLLSTEPGGQRLMLKDSLIISASPEVMGGTPVFAGTRVPVQTLLDYLKAGESIDDFLDGFPTVTREQVIALPEEAEKQLVGLVRQHEAPVYECIDRKFTREFVDYEVKTVSQMGWAGVENGQLLALAQAEFDVFITVERNLSFQQNLPQFNIAVIVLQSPSNRLAELKLLAPEVLAILATAAKGQATVISA